MTDKCGRLSNPYKTPSNSSNDHSVSTFSSIFKFDQDTIKPSGAVNIHSSVTPSPLSALNEDVIPSQFFFSNENILSGNVKESLKKENNKRLCASHQQFNIIKKSSSPYACSKKDSSTNIKVNFTSKFKQVSKQDSSPPKSNHANYGNDQVTKSSILPQHQFPHRVGQNRLIRRFSIPIEISCIENRKQDTEETLHDDDDELLSFVAFHKK